MCCGIGRKRLRILRNLGMYKKFGDDPGCRLVGEGVSRRGIIVRYKDPSSSWGKVGW